MEDSATYPLRFETAPLELEAAFDGGRITSYRIRVIAYLLHRPTAKSAAESSDGTRGFALAGLRDLSNTQYATVQADSV